jgi:hypothetical protein
MDHKDSIMSTCKESLMLEKDIAGVRLEEHEHKKGVLALIPAGAVIRVDRTAPPLGRMQQVEWQGSVYGVFPQDLLKRVDRSNSRSGA